MDLDSVFPNHTRTEHKATRDDLPIADFKILHYAPRGEGPHFYLTHGAAENGSDFLLLSPREHAGHVDLLTSVAYYQCFYGLGVGSFYKYARGYFPESHLNRLYVSAGLPLAVPALWLVPVTEDEEKFAKAKGTAELEKLLATIDPLDEKRSSVV
ncbi:MAG TPA: hypothetical protein VFF73_13040 [Planctomycetota bacterium]|nr:hypothetical protein [Planctomycetota bacterium]